MTGHPGRRAVLTAVGAAVGTLALTAAPPNRWSLLTAPAPGPGRACEEGVTLRPRALCRSRRARRRTFVVDGHRLWDRRRGHRLGVSASNAPPARASSPGDPSWTGPPPRDTMGLAPSWPARSQPENSGTFRHHRPGQGRRSFGARLHDRGRDGRVFPAWSKAFDGRPTTAWVINLSLSLPATPALRGTVSMPSRRDIVVVASAGNRGTASDTSNGLRYPAAYPGVIGVTASNANGVVTDDNIHGAQVALAAPGPACCSPTGPGATAAMTARPSELCDSAGEWLCRPARQRFPRSRRPDHPPTRVTASRPQRDARDDIYGWGVVQPFETHDLGRDGSVGDHRHGCGASRDPFVDTPGP